MLPSKVAAPTQRDDGTYTELPADKQQSPASDTSLSPRSSELCYILVLGDGREVQKGGGMWLIRVEVRQKTATFCKAILLQLKNK